MPNPGKTLEELKKSGTYQSHSGRYRERVAAVEGFTPLGGPPKHFDEREADAWNEILHRASPGTLAEGDFMLVELAARLLVKSRYDWTNFSATNARVLQSLANDLGMSPIKRGRVSQAKKPGAVTPFDEINRILNAPPNKLKAHTDA